MLFGADHWLIAQREKIMGPMDLAVADEVVQSTCASGGVPAFGLLVQPEAACGAARRLESQPLSRRQNHLCDKASDERIPELEKFDRAVENDIEDIGSPNIYVGTALYWRP